ncbi:MAG TPA: cytochrome c [Phenylobacterium sp.]
MKLLLPALALLAAIATPVLADEPGPGGTKPPIPRDGREIYVFYCQACHMEGGKGAEGAAKFPALANNPRLGTSAYAISMIEKGRGGMPWFSDQLTPAQVAELVTYLRTNFGNNYKDPVTAADVQPFAKPPKSER